MDSRHIKPRGRRHPHRTKPGWLTLTNLGRGAALYCAFLVCSYSLSPSARLCPPALSCEEGQPGRFWDAAGTHGSSSAARAKGAQRKAGHLLERDVGLGLLAPDTCSRVCQDVPDCAYWMYSKRKQTGTCKLWALDQDPCRPTASLLFPFSTVRFSARAKDSFVGGPCREDTGGQGRSLEEEAAEEARDRQPQTEGELSEEIDVRNLPTEECPSLQCAAPVSGFLFDHSTRGHLKAVRMQQAERRGMDCYFLCRETPGCSVWMVDDSATDGDCKLWTKEQSPCEPTDPFDASTAHFVKNIPGRDFLIGGNCHKLKPRPPRKEKIAQ